MLKIPVLQNGINGWENVLISASDVLKIVNTGGPRHEVHTPEAVYGLDLPWDCIEEWLLDEGFVQLDENNIVNINRVISYDDYKGTVFFGPQDDPEAKTAAVAVLHKKRLGRLLGALQQSNETATGAEGGRVNRVSMLRDRFKDIKTQAVYLASFDPVTGLPNRSSFLDRIDRLIEVQHENRMLAILVLTVDRFAEINHALGLKAGDDLLVYLAESLKGCLNGKGEAARLCGGDFAVLLPEVSRMEEATGLGKKLQQLLASSPFVIQQREIPISVSIGISFSPNDGTDAETLLRHAFIALDGAKAKGGGIVNVFHPSLSDRTLEKMHLEIELQKAFKDETLQLQYQPLIRLKDGTVFGMEALLRWNHPTKGAIPPSLFIPAAEASGLIIPIGNWVVKQACRQNRAWQNAGLPPILISVNISVYQLEHPGFVGYIKEVLAETGLAPHYLCLEIRETVASDKISLALDTIERLKGLGVSISIDDFGTGYTSLSWLKRFKVNTLKIDKSFIDDLDKGSGHSAIAAALIRLCRELNIRSLAEGVETEGQLKVLKELGCDDIQGYLFSRPLSIRDAEQLLKENKSFSA
ncbi:bifunctional diguanylate cyclase/phosphodiesterase [Paenibacillus sp. CC-CFT747]|nr:bifunctional diguanylate cyclase/phosphodiesterase [Paenibacillus sp. CC-CFT747]